MYKLRAYLCVLVVTMSSTRANTAQELDSLTGVLMHGIWLVPFLITIAVIFLKNKDDEDRIG